MAHEPIPREVLEATGAKKAATEELDEFAYLGSAFNLEDEEALENWLPTEPALAEETDDPDLDEAAAEAGRAPYADESRKLYIGKEFTLEQFARWFAAQSLGTLPYNGIGIHHTYRPPGTTFFGPRTVDGIFSYYHREKGWTLGKGPHLWLYGGDNPRYKPGQTLVVVGTHPSHDGIGITGRNHRWLHIESFGDWDDRRMVPGTVAGFRFLLDVLSRRRGQPIRVHGGPSHDGPSTWQGALFHRDAKTDKKSCPGNTTKHDWFDKAMKAGGGPVPKRATVKREGKLLATPAAKGEQIGSLARGATVKPLGSGAAQWRRVRIEGWVRAGLLDEGEEDEVVEPRSSLLARPRVGVRRLERYVVSRPHGEYTDADARHIARLYARAAADVGLDSLLVFAQMALETGNLTSFWSQPPRRNPAGIGVTGEPGAGLSFPDWPTAVRAHVGRLLAYALKPGKERGGQKALIEEALGWRPLPEHLRGSAPTLAGLAGTWAADTEYAKKVCRVANEIRSGT